MNGFVSVVASWCALILLLASSLVLAVRCPCLWTRLAAFGFSCSGMGQVAIHTAPRTIKYVGDSALVEMGGWFATGQMTASVGLLIGSGGILAFALRQVPNKALQGDAPKARA